MEIDRIYSAGVVNPWSALGRDPDEYDQRFAEEARAGRDMHGEADFVQSLAPASVLDAGCGTGRVAIELARRGLEVEGVDLDATMLSAARRKAPQIPWHQADLAGLDLGRRFGVVVLAGNVMIFLTPGTEADVVAAMARHLAAEGALVAGFRLNGVLDLRTYDAHCAAAGLELAGRWATWDREPWSETSEYSVSLHKRR